MLDDISCKLDRDGKVATRGAVDAEDWALDVLEDCGLVFLFFFLVLFTFGLFQILFLKFTLEPVSLFALSSASLCSLLLLLPASAAFTDSKLHIIICTPRGVPWVRWLGALA